ncbi:MAG: hypothetical protein II680_04055, partial [Clostridia bacterium]|nr:hypothetical protein [Clostridia bacterium]
MFHVKLPNYFPKLYVSPKQIFVRSVLSVRLSESEHVREDRKTVSESRLRVHVPNARLNLRRKAAGLVLRMFQLHEQRPREDMGCEIELSIQGRAVRLCHSAK